MKKSAHNRSNTEINPNPCGYNSALSHIYLFHIHVCVCVCVCVCVHVCQLGAGVGTWRDGIKGR